MILSEQTVKLHLLLFLQTTTVQSSAKTSPIIKVSASKTPSKVKSKTCKFNFCFKFKIVKFLSISVEFVEIVEPEKFILNILVFLFFGVFFQILQEKQGKYGKKRQNRRKRQKRRKKTPQ